MSKHPFAAALLLLAASGSAHAMRCDGRVISTGDRDFEVRARCGEPAWRDSHREWLISGVDGPLERRVERVHEEWLYNPGPNALLRRLHFVDGRLVEIETGGYGVREIGAECSDVALSRGSTPGEVFLHCGEPISRNYRDEEQVERDGSGNARIRPLRREEWLYRGGSNTLRLVTFHDGRLERVERVSR